jgi:hypothetical protein
MNLIQNIPPTHNEINSLSTNEKMLYDRLIFLSGLHRSTYNNKEETIKKLKDRMNILEGEINAGNNNTKIKKELHQIIYTLYNFKKINHKDMKEYLQQI